MIEWITKINMIVYQMILIANSETDLKTHSTNAQKRKNAGISWKLHIG